MKKRFLALEVYGVAWVLAMGVDAAVKLFPFWQLIVAYLLGSAEIVGGGLVLRFTWRRLTRQ